MATTTDDTAYVTTTEAIQLAPELNSSITHILRSKDPLDAQEFSSVEYINKIFPNGTVFSARISTRSYPELNLTANVIILFTPCTRTLTVGGRSGVS
jgi:hypothetical protein